MASPTGRFGGRRPVPPAIPTAARLGALSGEQPRRYRDELGFPSFEALCKARKLPSRMTATKQIAVSTCSEPELKQLGATGRCSVLVRYLQKQNADPRRALAPNARVLGRALKDPSTSDIERALKEGTGPSEKQMDAARKFGRAAEAGAAALEDGEPHCERTCRRDLHRTAVDGSAGGRADESTQPPGGTGEEIRARLTRKSSFTWRRIH